MNYRELISGTVFLICGASAAFMGQDFYADAAYIPIGVGILMCLFAIPLIWRSVLSAAQPASGHSQTLPALVSHPLRFGLTLACCLVYYVALPIIGFYTSSTVFILVLAVLLGERRPTIIIVITLSFIALLYGLFALVLKRSLPVEFFLAS